MAAALYVVDCSVSIAWLLEEQADDYTEAALDALALLDFAWHDCYGQSAPPDRVIEDIWTVANGDLGRLISAAHLAVIDFRDLRLNAQDAKPSSETT